MFGTDLPVNAGVERAKYDTLRLTDEQYAWCMGETAREVFEL